MEGQDVKPVIKPDTNPKRATFKSVKRRQGIFRPNKLEMQSCPLIPKGLPMALKSSLKRSMDSDHKVQKNYLAEELPIMIHVNGQKYVKLVKQQKETRVNIREYKTDHTGKMYPTKKKGILLSLDDWHALMKIDDVVQQMKLQ